MDEVSRDGQDHQMPKDSGGFRDVLLWLVAVITTILVGWALRAAAPVAVPVLFAAFVALLVAPIDEGVARHLPRRFRWVGHAAAMTTVFLVLVAFVGSIWLAAQQAMSKVPGSVGGSQQLLPNFGGEVRGDSASQPGASAGTAGAEASGAQGSNGFASQIVDLFTGAGESLTGALTDWASGLASTILSAAGTTLAGAALVFFLALMMLVEAPRWRDKFTAFLSGSMRERSFSSLGVVAERLRQYLWARTILGVLTAVLYAGWLWMFGIDLLFVWALLAFLLNFIPTFGSIIAGILPIIYAFVQKDLGTAIFVGAGILVIEQVMGNYVDPRVQGRRVSISPLVVLIVLVLWSWIWGVAGAILAVPVTVTLVIVFAHVRQLRPLALMLSHERDMDGLDRMSGRAEE